MLKPKTLNPKPKPPLHHVLLPTSHHFAARTIAMLYSTRTLRIRPCETSWRACFHLPPQCRGTLSLPPLPCLCMFRWAFFPCLSETLIIDLPRLSQGVEAAASSASFTATLVHVFLFVVESPRMALVFVVRRIATVSPGSLPAPSPLPCPEKGGALDGDDLNPAVAGWRELRGWDRDRDKAPTPAGRLRASS